MVVDVLVTKEDAVLFFGLSCYCAAVAETMVLAVATTTDVAAVMIVFGLSFYYSAAAETMVSAVVTTTDAAASKHCFPKRGIADAIPPFI